MKAIKDWFVKLISEEVRKLNNELGMKEKTIHCHFVKIQSLELTIRNLQEELRLSKPKRDAKGRFTK